MTNTIKQITFTKTMVSKGVAAVGAAESAEALKLAFFKSIKGRVARDQITQARSAFQSVAYAYYDEHHKLDGALIEAIVEGKLKETTKLGALTIRQYKDNIRKMAVRWGKYYAKWLDTKEIGKVGGKAGTKKRATKGAVKPKKPVDKPELNQAPETTPLKRAIEQVSSIPRTVLMSTDWDAANEGLRQSIEEKAQELVALLQLVK